MTCTVCPGCGFDLAKLTAFRIGRLFVDNGGAHIWWADQVVKLTPSEKLIVSALARADGIPIKRHILAEIIGHEGDQPENMVAVLVSRINASFHALDAAFDRIENIRGLGLRWKIEA